MRAHHPRGQSLSPKVNLKTPVRIIVIMKRQRVYAPLVSRKRFKSLKSSTAGATFQNQHYMKGPRRTGTLAQQIKSLQRVVARNVPEIKYVDTALDTTDIPTTGSVRSIAGIAQGDNDQQRAGDCVLVTSIRCSGFFVRGTITLAANAQYRIAVVYDKQQVADTAPAAGDIFEYPAEPTSAMIRAANIDRFKILHMSPVYYGNMMVLSSALTGNTPTQRTGFEWNWKGTIRVNFNGANATDLQRNNIYFVLLSNDTTGDFDGTSRVGFTDV